MSFLSEWSLLKTSAASEKHSTIPSNQVLHWLGLALTEWKSGGSGDVLSKYKHMFSFYLSRQSSVHSVSTSCGEGGREITETYMESWDEH